MRKLQRDDEKSVRVKIDGAESDNLVKNNK